MHGGCKSVRAGWHGQEELSKGKHSSPEVGWHSCAIEAGDVPGRGMEGESNQSKPHWGKEEAGKNVGVRYKRVKGGTADLPLEIIRVKM